MTKTDLTVKLFTPPQKYAIITLTYVSHSLTI